MQFSSGEVVGSFSFSWDDDTLSSMETFPLKLPETHLTGLIGNACKNVSSWSTGLLCRFCWIDSPLPATTTEMFSECLLSHTLGSHLEMFYTTNNICNFWHSKLQQISTHTFCSWDKIFTQKEYCGSPRNLCKCTISSSSLSTKNSSERNLYFSWSNHLVTCFTLEMNNGGFSKNQNMPSDTDRYKAYFSPLVFFKSLWTLWKEFSSICLNCGLLKI